MNELLSKIKYNRLPEAFLIEIVKGMSISKDIIRKHALLYEYNNSIVFEHSITTGVIYANYDLIWSVFEEKYGLVFDDIGKLLVRVWNKYSVEKGYESVQYFSYSRCTWYDK